MRRYFRPFPLIFAGVMIVAAPLLYGLVRGVTADETEDRQITYARKLLDTYQEHAPPRFSMPRIDWDADIERCGYTRDQLFDADDRGSVDGWSPYRGYLELLFWRTRVGSEAIQNQRAVSLREHMSAFSMEFLRVCIRQSGLAPVCASKVRSVLARDGWRDDDSVPQGLRFDPVIQNRVICGYLDGNAARRGNPIVSR